MPLESLQFAERAWSASQQEAGKKLLVHRLAPLGHYSILYHPQAHEKILDTVTANAPGPTH